MPVSCSLYLASQGRVVCGREDGSIVCISAAQAAIAQLLKGKGLLLSRLHPVFSFLLVVERLEQARCTTARETGVSEVDGRAEEKSKGLQPYFFVLPSHSPRGCASRSLQSLNYCGREKEETACSLIDLILFVKRNETVEASVISMQSLGKRNKCPCL